MKHSDPPLNIAQLNARLEEASREFGVPITRIRRILCTLIVSQMLPEAVTIKGGMGLKLRLGERGTRATADLDVSTRQRGTHFDQAFAARLAAGWGTVPASRGALRHDPDAPDRIAFTATLKTLQPHDPGLIQPQYVMHPYRVTLSFLGREWAGLDVELSDPEIEPQGDCLLAVDHELFELNEHFGFGMLQLVEMIELELQMAQKIHAVTDPDYTRAHDLVDLQLLWGAAPKMGHLRDYCLRTFHFRNVQNWPPLPLRTMEGWGPAYRAARAETQIGGDSIVLDDIDAARNWLIRLINSIEDASTHHSNGSGA